MEVNLENGDTVFVKGVLVDNEAAFSKLKGDWHAHPGAAAAALQNESESDDKGGDGGDAGDAAPEKAGRGRARKGE